MLRAQGFLHGLDGAWPRAAIDALHPTSWRVRSQGDEHAFDRAAASGAKVTLLMSDAWWGATYNAARGGALAPWTDSARYRQWVHDFVSRFLTSGRRPAYWEVQNEPGQPGFLNSADTAAWTPDRILDQFRIAYEEIIAIDPNAKVIGPSIAQFVPTPGSCRSCPRQGLDLQTFLDYSVAHGIRPAAIVWHENEQSLSDMGSMPLNIADHVAQVRAMVAARAVGTPEIIVNEYGAPWSHVIPGWSVGDISALEAANVDAANRSCWQGTTETGSTYSECDRGLDGLLSASNTDTLGNYWVHQAYGTMTGTRLDTSTSSSGLSVFATRDTGGAVRALVGRHEECTPAVITAGCTSGLTPPPAQPLTLSLTGSTQSMKAVVTRIPASGGPLAAPLPVLDSVVTPVGGKIQVRLPAVADGEAYIVTMTPQGPAVASSVDSARPTSGPGVADHSGSPWAFYRGTGGSLQYRAGSSTSDLGGQIVGAPDAATSGSGRVDVVARGIDDHIWARTFDGSKWGAWFDLGGRTVDAPSIVSWGAGRLDVFATGADHRLLHRWSTNGTTWSAWEQLDGYLTSGPDASSWGVGRLDIVARGKDGQAVHRFFSGTWWSAWRDLGGQLLGAPAAASPAPNRFEIIARGTDNMVWVRSWNGVQWLPWAQLNGPKTSADPDALGSAGRTTVVVKGADGLLYAAVRPTPAVTFGAWSQL